MGLALGFSASHFSNVIRSWAKVYTDLYKTYQGYRICNFLGVAKRIGIAAPSRLGLFSWFLLSRVFCGHWFHYDCLRLWMTEPPFGKVRNGAGRKSTPRCASTANAVMLSTTVLTCGGVSRNAIRLQAYLFVLQ